MKSIGSFILVLVILCICFVKCTSDKTKLVVYRTADVVITNQIAKCEQRMAEEEKQKADSVSSSNKDIPANF